MRSLPDSVLKPRAIAGLISEAIELIEAPVVRYDYTSSAGAFCLAMDCRHSVSAKQPNLDTPDMGGYQIIKRHLLVANDGDD